MGSIRKNPRLGATVGAVLVVLLGALIWLLLIRDGDEGTAGDQTGGDPVEASRGEIVRLSEELGQPIYGIRQPAGTKLELTELSNGQIFVRYLPENVEIGAPEASYLAIGTYPVPDATSVLESLSEQEGAVSSDTDGGDRLIVSAPGIPESVYVASETENPNYQVEVYDPHPQRALRLAEADRVRPIE